jgi:hypothetical protein
VIWDALTRPPARERGDVPWSAEAITPEWITAIMSDPPAARRALAMHEREPRTLLHSDVHLGNWYVTGDGRMGLCDWALFRAAEAVSAGAGAARDSVEVSLTFQLTPRVREDALEIRAVCSAEAPLVTRLPRPF